MKAKFAYLQIIFNITTYDYYLTNCDTFSDNRRPLKTIIKGTKKTLRYPFTWVPLYLSQKKAFK